MPWRITHFGSRVAAPEIFSFLTTVTLPFDFAIVELSAIFLVVTISASRESGVRWINSDKDSATDSLKKKVTHTRGSSNSSAMGNSVLFEFTVFTTFVFDKIWGLTWEQASMMAWMRSFASVSNPPFVAVTHLTQSCSTSTSSKAYCGKELTQEATTCITLVSPWSAHRWIWYIAKINYANKRANLLEIITLLRTCI